MSSIDIIMIILVSLLAFVCVAFVIVYSLLMARKLKLNKVKLQNQLSFLPNEIEIIPSQTVLVNQSVRYAIELQVESVLSTREEYNKLYNDLHIMQLKGYETDLKMANINSFSDRMKYAA